MRPIRAQVDLSNRTAGGGGAKIMYSIYLQMYDPHQIWDGLYLLYRTQALPPSAVGFPDKFSLAKLPRKVLGEVNFGKFQNPVIEIKATFRVFRDLFKVEFRENPTPLTPSRHIHPSKTRVEWIIALLPAWHWWKENYPIFLTVIQGYVIELLLLV